MPVSALSLPGALEKEPVMPWAQVEEDPDEAAFEDEAFDEDEDWDDVDEPDELEFDDEDDWDDDEDDDEYEGYVIPDDEEAVGW